MNIYSVCITCCHIKRFVKCKVLVLGFSVTDTKGMHSDASLMSFDTLCTNSPATKSKVMEIF